jgi:protein-disulfide isomerase
MDILPPPIEPSVSPKEKDMIIFKRSTFFAALLPITFTIGLALGFVFWGLPLQQLKAQPPQAAVPTGEPQKVKRYDVPVDGHAFLGPSDAPITLVEFSDYECPYCRIWHAEVWPQLQADFKDKIRLVYRDLPLASLHTNAAPAAEAAECAGEQNQYFAFHDKLFSGEMDLGQPAFEKYAGDLSLDLPKFKECVSSRRYQSNVQADVDLANQIGISSTPTFFVNGLAVVGAQPYEVFKQIIEKELAGEIPQ